MIEVGVGPRDSEGSLRPPKVMDSQRVWGSCGAVLGWIGVIALPESCMSDLNNFQLRLILRTRPGEFGS